MPEKNQSEVAVFEETKDVLEPINKGNNKYKKIFLLFRNLRKENSRKHSFENEYQKHWKRNKKRKTWDLDERKKNMENSWTELPHTLQRKKEKIFQEILSQFHDSDSSDLESSKATSFPHFGKKSKEKSYNFSEENDEPTCEYFRPKGEDELDAISFTQEADGKNLMKSSKPEKCLNHNKKKNLLSKIICEKPVEEMSLEKIRKLCEEDFKRDDENKENPNDKKDELYSSEAAVNEINLLFHDLIADSGNQTPNSSIVSDSENSETYVHVTSFSEDIDKKLDGSFENDERHSAEGGTALKTILRRSESSDSLLNESSSSESLISEIGQHETAFEKNCGEVASSFRTQNKINFFEQNAEIIYVNEINDAKPKAKESPEIQITTEERKSCCEETLNYIAKLNKNDLKTAFEDKCKEITQYSDIIFPLPANTQGLFVNEDFNRDMNIKTLQNEEQKDVKSDCKIIYQELDFPQSSNTKKEMDNCNKFDNLLKEKLNEQEIQDITFPNMSEVPSQLTITVSNSLCKEEQAKKKSAEAIAKELSTQIFLKRKQSTNCLESCQGKKTVITISGPNLTTEFSKNDNQKENHNTKSAILKDMNVTEEGKTDSYIKKTTSTSKSIDESWEAIGENKGLPGSDLQYFSVADWRKAVALGTKRGISSIAMETIVEEPETDTTTKLTVCEILKRFEELCNQHFSDKLCITDDERTSTLKQIYQTLKCLEEKVKNFENWQESAEKNQQYLDNSRATDHSASAWTGRGAPQRLPHSAILRSHQESEEIAQTAVNDGKHSLLQFAIHHFRQSPEKFEMLKTSDGSISGSLKVIESKNKKNKEKGKGFGKDSSEWTWKEQVDLVKFTAKPIEQSLLQLDTLELSDLAVECFICLMRYMGDLPMPTDVSEVKCVYTILMHCHKFEKLRDEVYCQLMKQTTNNKSIQQESCQRGWRLFSIIAAYFVCSDTLKPFLFKYLETAAYDKRRAYHGTAMVCLQNLRKTFKYGGRKNVPSVEEITAISAGRNSKRQIYRLPGGTEKVVNTKSTTVVQDVIEELCVMINVTNPQEMEEFSVYCIVEGDTFTMPLAKEEYILDVTTELHKNHQVFYLIFCRSVWYFPLKLDSQLYVEVVFNQIAPDYLEGLLLIMPGESLEQEVIYDISKIAALLHKAADMTQVPSMKETKFLLPKPALSVRDVKPSQWVNMVQSNWQECENLTTIQAKAQVLDVLSKWPLFGSSFFAVKKASEPKERTDHILALNRSGVHFIDLITHETLLHYPFSEVISTRKVKSEDGTLFLDMKCGNLMQQRITRLQTDQAHEISRLIRQYITMQQRMGGNQM